MLFFLVLFSLLQLSSLIINCRISCKRCRERTDHPELMEVYCAMCSECKERRREWLQGVPSISIKNKETPYPHSLKTDYHDSDDCFSSLCEDPCEDQNVLLTGSLEPSTITTTTITTTTTTTTTTSTTSTTRRPCPPKPKCAKPCALPLLPWLPMCSTCPANQISTASLLNTNTRTLSMESMYLYLGVPKKLLNELKLEKKVSL